MKTLFLIAPLLLTSVVKAQDVITPLPLMAADSATSGQTLELKIDKAQQIVASLLNTTQGKGEVQQHLREMEEQLNQAQKLAKPVIGFSLGQSRRQARLVVEHLRASRLQSAEIQASFAGVAGNEWLALQKSLQEAENKAHFHFDELEREHKKFLAMTPEDVQAMMQKLNAQIKTDEEERKKREKEWEEKAPERAEMDRNIQSVAERIRKQKEERIRLYGSEAEYEKAMKRQQEEEKAKEEADEIQRRKEIEEVEKGHIWGKAIQAYLEAYKEQDKVLGIVMQQGKRITANLEKVVDMRRKGATEEAIQQVKKETQQLELEREKTKKLYEEARAKAALLNEKADELRKGMFPGEGLAQPTSFNLNAISGIGAYQIDFKWIQESDNVREKRMQLEAAQATLQSQQVALSQAIIELSRLTVEEEAYVGRFAQGVKNRNIAEAPLKQAKAEQEKAEAEKNAVEEEFNSKTAVLATAQKALSASKDAVALAQKAVDSAHSALAELQRPGICPAPGALESAKATLESAEKSLADAVAKQTAAQKSYDDAKKVANEVTTRLVAAENALATATAAVVQETANFAPALVAYQALVAEGKSIRRQIATATTNEGNLKQAVSNAQLAFNDAQAAYDQAVRDQEDMRDPNVIQA